MLAASSRPFIAGGRGCRSSNSNRTVICHGLKENVAALPSIEGIQQVVLQPLGHKIPNAEGISTGVAAVVGRACPTAWTAGT